MRRPDPKFCFVNLISILDDVSITSTARLCQLRQICAKSQSTTRGFGVLYLRRAALLLRRTEAIVAVFKKVISEYRRYELLTRQDNRQYSRGYPSDFPVPLRVLLVPT